MHRYIKSAIIVGGGPAGCQCALWLKTLGHFPIIIERSNKLGGLQNDNPYTDIWHAGRMNQKGRELARNMHRHIEKMEIPVLYNSVITHCVSAPEGFTIEATDHIIRSPYIVIATGASIRRNTQTPHAHLNHAHINRPKTTLHTHWEANIPEVFESLKTTLLDKRGFIATDSNCQTPIPGIYAIGEVANRMHACVTTAMADGVVAAKTIQEKLESLLTQLPYA